MRSRMSFSTYRRRSTCQPDQRRVGQYKVRARQPYDGRSVAFTFVTRPRNASNLLVLRGNETIAVLILAAP
jgi:hypothetical protein